VIDAPANFVADPFMVRTPDAWHLFFEVMNWKTRKGEIGLASSSDGLDWRYRQIVLAEAFHLSYPYVFEWDGDFYMVPESCQAGGVRLYKAANFPDRWNFAGTLLEGPYLADASLVYFDRRWWMFVDTSLQSAHDTLCLFFADDLHGPWRAHPKSPIVAGDPRNARPAGRVIVDGERLIRFAQNCSNCYGEDVRAFEIVELSPWCYLERPLGPESILGPGSSGWNAGGMHHLDPHRLDDGNWIACVDGWFLPPAIA
jgi:hypothetical protein